MITSIFLSFFESSISVSLIIVLLLLLAPFLNRRYAAKWKYWIWIVLALRLMIPVVENDRRSDTGIQLQRETLTSSESVQTPADMLTFGTARRQFILELPAQIAAPVSAQPEKAGGNISMLDIIAWVWVAVSLLFLSVHLISYFLFKHRILKRGKSVRDRDILCLLLKLKRELHIRCRVKIVEYAGTASPMMIGFFNRLLVLPEEQYGMGEAYSREEYYFILKHELSHLKRGDTWIKLLFVAANAVHWFNPLVWIMRKEAAFDMELSCDERVIQGMDYDARKAYTETLLFAIHKQKARETALSTGFYGGRHIMKRRFQNILGKTAKKNGAAVLICTIILTVSLGTLVGCSIPKESTEDGSEFHSSEAEPSGSDYPAETVYSTSEEEEFYLWWNPLLLDYYNSFAGHKALCEDFAYLAGEGMSVEIEVRGDDILEVTVRYEDDSLLTEGIEDELAQQLEAMTDQFQEQRSLYCTDIIGPASVRILTVTYIDREGNVLASQAYPGQ
ncbi:MAG TPA: hypothetical protein DCZ91_08115 [Lachnospiraceae bacterium]|nr:hypothetical protein [Lachnospiraceae bacterium]